MFGCSLMEEVISRRKDKFPAKYTAMDNVITGALLSKKFVCCEVML